MEKQSGSGPKIRAVIFDLGGVILRTDDPQPRKALAERYGRTYHELDKIVFGNPVSWQAEHGLATPAQVWQEIARLLGLSPDEVSVFRQEFFGGDKVDQDLVRLIQNLRIVYQTALLSNQWYVDLPAYLRQELQMPDLFDIIISSAKEGVAKPDEKIFLHTLARLKIKAEEAIFVDDNQENILASERLGLHTVHFKNPAQARSDLLSILQTTGSPILDQF
jgi:epoxide hydrolase-like predicted phosphatase